MSKRKSRSIETTLQSSTESLLTVRTGFFECYEFLAPNEYSEKTFGVLAVLIRNSVGGINFSSIMDKVKQNVQNEKASDYIQLLEKERMNLRAIDASIEKCLMLNRLISYINDNSAEFLSTVAVIREDMRLKMIDESSNQPTTYLDDFRQREIDFNHRRNAQNMRRLFYLSHKEAREPASLIHLQNKVTEHLDYLLHARKIRGSASQNTGREELLKTINNSFMITTHPCNGDIPVIIYDSRGSSQYVAKVKMTIVSLLHDFMKKYPNMIELLDIKLKLVPEDKGYTVQSPKSITWQICELQGHPSDRSPRMYFAESSSICIVQSDENTSGVAFAQKLHAFELTVKLKLDIKEYNISTTRLITLTSLQFAIAQRTSQIPRLLASVVLNDIQKYSNNSPVDIPKLINFLTRYFMHRTGVFCNHSFSSFLQKELIKAQVERASFTTIEERFIDFLTSYVHQVEFMAKHPVLSMFYTAKLFLGICDSEQAALCLKALSTEQFPITAFRMNTIRIDYQAIANKSIVGRVIEPSICAFRIDIYNRKNKCIDNFTLDEKNMMQDLNKLIYTSNENGASELRLLANFDQTIGRKTFESFDKYKEYYDPRLREICVSEMKYKPLGDIISAVNLLNHDDSRNDINANNSFPTISVLYSTTNPQQNHDVNDVQMPLYTDNYIETVPLQSILSPDTFYQHSAEETQSQSFHVFSPSLFHETGRELICQTETLHQQQEPMFTTNSFELEQDHCCDIFEQWDDIQRYLKSPIGEILEEMLNQYL